MLRSFSAGGGEMGSLIRAYAWAATSSRQCVRLAHRTKDARFPAAHVTAAHVHCVGTRTHVALQRCFHAHSRRQTSSRPWLVRRCRFGRRRKTRSDPCSIASSPANLSTWTISASRWSATAVSPKPTSRFRTHRSAIKKAPSRAFSGPASRRPLPWSTRACSAKSEERLQIALSAGNSVGTWDWDVPSDRVFADARFAELYGVDPERAKAGAPIAEFFGGIHPDDVVGFRPRSRKVWRPANRSVRNIACRSRTRRSGGSSRRAAASSLLTESRFGSPASVSISPTRKKAEIRREALVRLTDDIRDLHNPEDLTFAASTILGETLKVSRASYGTIDPDAETLTVERDWLAPGVESLAGTLNLRDYGSFIDSLKRGEFIAIADVDQDERTAPAAEALKSRSAGAFVNVPVIEQGRLVAVLFLNNAKARKWASEDLALVQEIAERTRTATERLKATEALRQANATLEAKVEERTAELVAAAEALRQSQKMEAIGQLTGGIAHDFNNLLAGISGKSRTARQAAFAGPPGRRGSLHQCRPGIDPPRRLADATPVGFRPAPDARSQGHRREPHDRRHGRPADGGRSVPTSTSKSFRPAAFGARNSILRNWRMRILNLCINARDAMAPNGGRITIETANKWLDDRAAKERDLPPGQYVSLSVSDTGTGMTADVIEKIFDPFFTTKPLGQGTGLGLSMIYGFVRQSGGQVRVYSEIGKGTTMCLYFPRFVGELSDEERPEDLLDRPRRRRDGAGHR